MLRLVVVTDKEMADGFRLAGVRVRAIGISPEEINESIKELIADETVGIIAVSRRFLEQIDRKVIAVVERGTRPIIIPIPDMEDARQKEGKTSYIAALVQRSIGFKIELKK